jgi:gliding-associated putative ABC transporter substrate-binding component GldG
MKENAGVPIDPGIDVVVIQQPTRPFSERDKYELDQYLMRGGSIIWMLDQQRVDMDLFEKRSTLSELRDLNLDDMFMKYGFKLNYDLVQDLNCEPVEVFQETPDGGVFSSHPWIFYPVLYRFPDHPVNRNAEAALFRYASSIDTFAQEGVRKTVLMQSSAQSRALTGRQFIDLNQYLQTPPAPEAFQDRGNRILGLLLEGQFVSLFRGREQSGVLLDSLVQTPPQQPFVAGNTEGLPGRMVVISDGAFGQSKSFRGRPTAYLPYDNQTLILNAIDYLAGDEALTGIRSREVIVRRLDRDKVRDHAFSLRLFNLLLPVLLVLLFGLLRFYLRARRHQRLKEE